MVELSGERQVGLGSSRLILNSIIASAFGGVITSVAMTPLDVIKIRMQVVKLIGNTFSLHLGRLIVFFYTMN